MVNAESPLIDAVYIASPSSCHASQAVMFLRQGKHVLCEKPLATNAREARAMMETAVAHRMVFMEAMKTTLTPLSLKANLFMLSSGVDGEGSLILKYDDMEGVVQFSKITDSSLPSEIQGENGCLIIDRIADPKEAVYTPYSAKWLKA
ncbi:Gfo/Idh/MocA family protein [Paenibacillus sp. BR2-3]|uniref:Gfo/Idh/MocA family protein n=1 Tax=Paenibacillus sp. BR2-3 TaxID=3048494 RepID=UPI003977B2AF